MAIRKYLQQGKTPHPHIGKMVKKALEEKHVTQAELARRLDLTPNSIVEYIKQPSLQFGILWNIGIAINHDFLSELVNSYPSETLVNEESKLLQQLNEAEIRIKDLEKEIEIYKAALGIKSSLKS